ncbi:DUF3558 domain-containing protein [Saccharothrix carnea]|uniref:DUF3558 domain-containing protein n=1 Tax=Saccharothrix carnea TaxID=1280637 RepID=UPI0015E7E2FE|nr:DUF3558 domain-containing protein [Saccharothrix carnea]
MRHSGKAFIALLLVAGAVLAGCTQKTPGDANSTTTANETTAASGTSEPTVEFPRRPSEIKLDGIADACVTLTKDQQRELGIDQALSEPMDVIEDREMPGCSFRANSRPLFSYEVTLISDEGAGYWQSGGNLDVIQKTVAGYGALQVTLAGTTKGDCALAVDVADGQQLFVSFLPIGDGFTQDQMCQNAAKGAEMALTTLQTLK